MEAPHSRRISLRLKYLLEFLVVFLGVTISFWLSEWNEGRKIAALHSEDVTSLLDDLNRDKERLAIVDQSIRTGTVKINRIIAACDAFRAGSTDYETFADSLVTIGSPYSYPTFFMNNSTYKSLISDGRIHEFPTSINKQIRDYYEYVSKRVNDNNHIVDDICLNYYNNHHPLVQLFTGMPKELRRNAGLLFMQSQDVRLGYQGRDFYIQSLAMRSRIGVHESQIEEYIALRDTLEGAIIDYQKKLLEG